MAVAVAEEGEAAGRSGLRRARAVVLGIFTADMLVLLVTGIMLFFVYLPEPDPRWVAEFGDHYNAGSSFDLPRTITLIHRLASHVALPLVIVTCVLVVIERTRRREVAVGAGLVVTVLAASFTGYLLPWDQIALWAVRVGTNMRGFRPLLDGDQVRFVIMNGARIERETIVRWLVVHTVVLGVGIGGLLLAAWRPRAGWRSWLGRLRTGWTWPLRRIRTRP